MQCLNCHQDTPNEPYCSLTCAEIGHATLRAVEEVQPVLREGFYRPRYASPPGQPETLLETVSRIARDGAVQTLTESLVSTILDTAGSEWRYPEHIRETAQAIRTLTSRIAA